MSLPLFLDLPVTSWACDSWLHSGQWCQWCICKHFG